jgi:hypothetical protein
VTAYEGGQGMTRKEWGRMLCNDRNILHLDRDYITYFQAKMKEIFEACS